jgi:hypothetical protein
LYIINRFSTFYGTRNFITALTTPLYLSLSCTSLLVFLDDSFSLVFPALTYKLSLASHSRYMSGHLILLHLILLITYIMQLLVMQFPPPSRQFCQYIILSSSFSNTINFGLSLNIRDQVPYPYTTTGKISFFYKLSYSFRQQRRREYVLD